MDFLTFKELSRKTENLDTDGISSRLNKSLTIRLLHSTIGLSTEVAELKQGVRNNDDVNVKEEIGDCLWYIAQAANAVKEHLDLDLEIKIIKNNEEMEKLSDSPINCCDKLIQLSADNLDMMKKVIFYGKIEIDRDFIASFQTRISEVVEYLHTLAAHYNHNLSNCAQVNLYKLQGVRYKDGFNSEDAENRDLEKEYRELKK